MSGDGPACSAVSMLAQESGAGGEGGNCYFHIASVVVLQVQVQPVTMVVGGCVCFTSRVEGWLTTCQLQAPPLPARTRMLYRLCIALLVT